MENTDKNLFGEENEAKKELRKENGYVESDGSFYSEQGVSLDDFEKGNNSSEIEGSEVENNPCNSVVVRGTTDVVPAEERRVTLYRGVPENSNVEREGFSSKQVIAIGLACLLVGGIVGGMLRGCNSNKNVDNNGVIVSNDKKSEHRLEGPVISGNSTNGNSNTETTVSGQNPAQDSTSEELNIVYITKDNYIEGVRTLCDDINKNYGLNYEPSQLTSFYYFANMENISNELFVELVRDGLIPDTETKILANVFAITSDLKTKNVKTGKSNIDFSKVFVDQDIVMVVENWETKFNTLNGANNDGVKKVMDELEEFVIVSPEQGYNTLPTGGKDIFNWVIADSISIKAGVVGVAPTSALDNEIHDMTTAVTLLKTSLDCFEQPQTEKQKVK